MEGTGKLSFDELWKLCSDAAQAAGVELFDLDVPQGNGSALRVFIWRRRAVSEVLSGAVSGREAPDETAAGDDVTGEGVQTSSGITHENCAAVSRTILGWDEERNFLHDSWTLEVSSPGINRKLTRPAHFDSAVGERVLVKHTEPAPAEGEGDGRPQRTVRTVGVLRSADPESIVVVDEKRHEEMRIPRNRIREAKVDFQF